MMNNLTQLFTYTLGRFLQRKLDSTMTFKIKFPQLLFWAEIVIIQSLETNHVILKYGTI